MRKDTTRGGSIFVKGFPFSTLHVLTTRSKLQLKAATMALVLGMGLYDGYTRKQYRNSLAMEAETTACSPFSSAETRKAQVVPEQRVVTASYPTTRPKAIPLNRGIEKTIANTIENAITVEGIELPEKRVVDGIHLTRNGHGLRSITYFGIGIRIYVAAMYSEKPISSAEQALGTIPRRDSESRNISSPDGNGALQLDFTFLRYVNQSQVRSAWAQQLDYSVTHTDYERYQEDRDRFIQLASEGPIENHGTQSIQMVGEETRIIDQGKLRGIIYGKDFQQSFLSMWFGSKAVSEDLKSSLLGGDK